MPHTELDGKDISSLSETQQRCLKELTTYDFQQDVEQVDALITTYLLEIEERPDTKGNFQEVLISIGGLYMAEAAYERALAINSNYLERFHEPQKELEKGRLQGVGSTYAQERHLHEKHMMESHVYSRVYKALSVLVDVIVDANEDTTKGMVQESIVTNYIANK